MQCLFTDLQVLKEVVSTTWGAEAAKDITATSPSQDGPACMRDSSCTWGSLFLALYI